VRHKLTLVLIEETLTAELQWEIPTRLNASHGAELLHGKISAFLDSSTTARHHGQFESQWLSALLPNGLFARRALRWL
jgi:hypothetical protein